METAILPLYDSPIYYTILYYTVPSYITLYLQKFTQMDISFSNSPIHLAEVPFTKFNLRLRLAFIKFLGTTFGLCSAFALLALAKSSRSSPRPISSSQLHALLHFHPCPIHLVVSEGSYSFRMGSLILGGASRLDAFSVYPVRAWLPCRGVGTPTGTPAARPSRSSRTKDSSSQISSARAG